MQAPRNWRIADHLTAHPGCCNVTGTSTGPHLVTDLFVAYDGLFQPSVHLVEQLAAAIGWAPVEGEVLDPKTELAQLRARNAELEAEKESWDRLKAAIDLTLKNGLVVTKHREIKLREPSWLARAASS